MLKVWGVVHVRKKGGIPIWVDGPYYSKKIAEEVRRMNIEDEEVEFDNPKDIGTFRYKVVPMTKLLSHSELFGHTKSFCKDKDLDHSKLVRL